MRTIILNKALSRVRETAAQDPVKQTKKRKDLGLPSPFQAERSVTDEGGIGENIPFLTSCPLLSLVGTGEGLENDPEGSL